MGSEDSRAVSGLTALALLAGAVFPFFSIRSFHAVRSEPASKSSFAAANRICVDPILPQPPGIGRNTSGSSATNAVCCSTVSMRLPYPWLCEASVAKILPPTRKSVAPMCEPSSAPSRLNAIRLKSAAFMAIFPVRAETPIACPLRSRSTMFPHHAAKRLLPRSRTASSLLPETVHSPPA